MRLITRTLTFVIVILGAFWFTAENARELVVIDLAFLRVRASLPLVVFGSILAGMGLSLLTGWRAERRREGRVSSPRPDLLRAPQLLDDEPSELEELRSYPAADRDPRLRDAEARSAATEDRSRDEPEPMGWR